MKEARIEARVKNNVLYQAICDLGMTAAEFCRRTGFSPTTLYGLITLRILPLKKNGEFTEQSKCLADLVGIAPEALFPVWLYQLEKKAANIEFSFSELPPRFNPLLKPGETDIEQEVLSKELIEKMPSLLEKLDERQRTVVQLRFGLGNIEPKSHDKTGEVVGLSRERVREIEKKALQKLRRALNRH